MNKHTNVRLYKKKTYTNAQSQNEKKIFVQRKGHNFLPFFSALSCLIDSGSYEYFVDHNHIHVEKKDDRKKIFQIIMAHCKCEAIPSCSNFQSAICLHCNCRLCLVHITEHNQVVPSSIQNLLQEVEVTFQQINNEYEKSRETYNYLLTSLNQWRTRQTEKLQELYDHHLQTIESHQEALNLIQQDLTELLDRNARQPLKYIQNQQHANMEIVGHIRETIEKTQKHCGQLKWDPSILPPVDIEYDPRDTPSMPISMHIPKPSMICLKLILILKFSIYILYLSKQSTNSKKKVFISYCYKSTKISCIQTTC